MSDEQQLTGGSTHPGGVVRVGDTVRRPRGSGADLVEALLVHLERVGFDAAPRFRGHDELGRQILTFVDGDVTVEPEWLHDDATNRARLADVARMIRRLHDATDGFVPPHGASPRRPCPVPGDTWLHGDVHYGNVVFDGRRPVAFIDWDFATRGDPLYDVVTLLMSARNPRPDLPGELADRAASARATLDAVLAGYGADDGQRRRATSVAATFCDGAADYLESLGLERSGARSTRELDEEIDRRRYLAAWWREQPPVA